MSLPAAKARPRTEAIVFAALDLVQADDVDPNLRPP
jgi:hypothetical protein